MDIQQFFMKVLREAERGCLLIKYLLRITGCLNEIWPLIYVDTFLKVWLPVYPKVKFIFTAYAWRCVNTVIDMLP